MTWLDLESDRAFGPQFRDKFDFTLEFEYTILSILPASLFLAGVPIFFFLYQHCPNIVLSGKLLWVKLASALAIFGVEIASLSLWSNSGQRASGSAIGAATLLVASALCLAPIIYWEHRRTLQSTTFVAVWLLISALCDIVRSRSYFLRPGLNDVGILAVVSATLKIFTLGLEEVSKMSLIVDEGTRRSTGREATSGFLSRTLFVWINRMFFFGFKNILRLDTLDSLGPAFRSQYLSDHLNVFWNAYDGSVSGSLELACVRANLGPWLSAAFPRLCLGIFTVAQPLLLKSVVTYVQSEDKSTGRRDGLIIAAAFIYGGLALSKVSYDHICYQIATQIRGMLVAQTSKKALKLKYPEAQNAAIITLMNVDMKNIAAAIPRLHNMWASVLQTVANLYILSGIVSEATVLVIGPVILSIAGTYYVGKNMPSAQKLWTAAISTRVIKTSRMLRQIRAVKMTGLEDVMANYVQGLRETEVEHSKETRTWLLRNYVIGTFCDCITSPVILAGGIFWTGLGSHFTPSNVFTALATVTLIGSTLKYLPDEFGYIQTGRAALERFEQYMALEERKDPRYTDLAAFSAEVARDQANNKVAEQNRIVLPETEQPARRVIEFYNANIAVEGTEDAVLEKTSITIERHELVMVVGPTGGGKSTLLRGILGEIELLSGYLYVEAGYIAYCDQTAWIWNASVQANIIGNSPVDIGWYDAVLTACLLKPDLRRLPHGDQTKVGSNGGNLSGGQKQRVALARAVHTRSPILVIDDILSTLDRQTAAEIFSRLFGANGLLKKSMTTVIMATHSSTPLAETETTVLVLTSPTVQFLGTADRILHVDADGVVTTRTDVEDFVCSEEIQEICNEISEASTQNGTDEQAAEEAVAFRAPEPEVMDDDIARQKGDLTIYLFYARSFQLFHALCWLIFMFMTAAGEVLSDGYVRIWMEIDPNNRLWYIGYVLIGSSAAFFMFLNARTLFLKLLPYSSLYLHRMLLDVLMRARLSFLTGTDHGSLVNRISQDLTMVSQQLPEGGMRVLYYCCRMLLRIGMIIAVTSYTVAILPLLIAAIYVIQLYYLRTSRQLRYLELETGAPLCTQFTESAAGLYHIRAFGWQYHSLEASLQLLDDSQKPFYYMYAAERWLGLVMDTITLVMALTVIIVTLCVQQVASASSIALSMLSLITLSFESMQFVRQWMLVETSIGALARTRDFVQNTPLEEDPDVITKTAEAWPQQGAIALHHVTARYGPEDVAPPVIDGVSLEIAPRAKVGIIGRTGSGKSSILLTLLGFLDYTGVITIDGVDISRIPRKKLRSVVTAISQDNLEFDGTVRYNLCPNPNDENAKMPFNEAALLVLLDRLQLLDLLDQQKPLDTHMATLGLSHGQKQLMSIARSCVRNYTYNTRIIIMDEATSNLDRANEKLVLQVFHELFNDCTVLTVAHRTETLKNADMIVKIANGRVASTRYPKEENPTAPSTEGTHEQSSMEPTAPSTEGTHEQSSMEPTAPITAEIYGRMPAVPSLPSTLRAYPGATGGTSSSVSSARESSHTPTQLSISSPAQQQTLQRPTAPVPMNPFFERLLCMSERNVEIGRQFNENRRIALGQKVVSQVDRLREKARIEAEEEENARAKAAAKIAQKREIEEARKLRKAEKAERKAKGKARAGKDAPMTEKGAGEGRAPSTEVFEEKDKQDVEEHGEKDQREMEEGNEEKRKEKGQ